MQARRQTWNVVFDLGGVVLDWNPAAVIAAVFDDSHHRALVTRHVVGDPDWIDLDRGTLPLADAIERARQRTGIEADRLHRLFETAVRSLVPRPETIALIERVKAAGNALFVLSNMHRASLAHLEATYDFFDLFDGRIISCEAGACKPEAAIYRRLLVEFRLDPTATVFIDDMQVNLDAARAHGIHTIRFADADSCRVELQRLGCI